MFYPFHMNDFMNLTDETNEITHKFRFIAIFAVISMIFRMHTDNPIETPIIVGGILARYEHDLRCKTGLYLRDHDDGSNLVALEIKKNESFPLGEKWYHRSRGFQVLSTIYALNCPTFLLTPKHWKLFVENKERNGILTFPFGDDSKLSPHLNSNLMCPMDETFLKAIIICMLSRCVISDHSKTNANANESSPIQVSVPRPEVKVHEKGSPIYNTVRIATPEIVKSIEAEITLKEEHQNVYRMSSCSSCCSE